MKITVVFQDDLFKIEYFVTLNLLVVMLVQLCYFQRLRFVVIESCGKIRLAY